MTADLVGRLRDWADGILETTAHDLLLEAADAIEQLTIYNSTNREIADGAERANTRLAAAEAEAREWANKANELAFKLAAAQRVVGAARNVAEDYGGRLTGPEEELVAALKATEAYLSEQSAPTAQNAHLSKRADPNSTATDRLQDPNATERSQNLNSEKQEGE